MKIFLLFLLIAVTLAATVVDGRPELKNDVDYKNRLRSNSSMEYQQNLVQTVDKSITDGIKQFSVNLFKAASEDQENVVLSPLSVHAVLSMIASGAKRATKDEMLSILHLPTNYQEGASDYRNLINKLKSNEDITVKLLNKVFINNQFPVKLEFRSTLQDHFNASAEQFDSHDLKKTTESANSWVLKETNDQIKDLLNPSHFANASMIVANVLYFKGQWINTFDDYSTKDGEFHGINGSHRVPMMTQEDYFKFGVLPEINATFIKLPYLGNEYSMIVILPDKNDGLKEVEKKLETVTLESIRKRGSISYIKVFLPKFRVETTIEMKALLQKMGLQRMFTNSADFSGISDSLSTVSDVVQKVFIGVNEAGTEAGATTYGKVDYIIVDDPSRTFNVDHPFHFKIIKTIGDNDGITLFAGSIKSL